LQWAVATTLLSARLAYTDMAICFFQAGLTYFGGQVATLAAPPAVSLAASPAVLPPDIPMHAVESPGDRDVTIELEACSATKLAVVTEIDVSPQSHVSPAADRGIDFDAAVVQRKVPPASPADAQPAVLLKFDEAIMAVLSRASGIDVAALQEVNQLIASRGAFTETVLQGKAAFSPGVTTTAAAMFSDAPPPVRRSFTPSLSPLPDEEVDKSRAKSETTQHIVSHGVDISAMGVNFASMPVSDAGGQLAQSGLLSTPPPLHHPRGLRPRLLRQSPTAKLRQGWASRF
jgi:hypothetical protein